MKKYFLFTLLMTSLASAFGQGKYLLFTGTYTSGSSKGIYIHSFDTKTGTAVALDSVKASNPSFLAFSPGEKILYAVNENIDGSVSYFSLDKQNRKLAYITGFSSEGKHPCYISVDKTGKWVVAGNYSSGNFTILAGYGNRMADTPVAIILHEGKSVDTKRQSSPHVHSAVFSPDNRFLLVNDLGTDKIVVYEFNERKGLVKLSGEYPVAAGSGPRHLAFHPAKQYVYLLNELTGTINVFRYHTKNGSLLLQQTISSTVPGFKGYAGSADIHLSPDGKFLYASNRGDANDIAIYAVNKKDGLLKNIGFQSVLGKAPRNFSIDPTGKYLLCANQDTDEIVVFNRNKTTGLLTDSGKRIKIPKPVCLKWIKL